MNIEPPAPTVKNAARFTGDAWRESIVVPHEGDQRMNVALVRFAPGARTAWHSHARGQYLRVTEGVARFGGRDGRIIEVRAGETLYTPPGEDHWHAAGPDCFMAHLAMFEDGDDPETSIIWKEHVTDDEYRGLPVASSRD